MSKSCRTRISLSLVCNGIALVAMVGCSGRETAPASSHESAQATTAPSVASTQAATTTPAIFLKPIADQSHLPNAHYVTDKIIAGAQPEGDEGFEELKAMGIKTIVSVDGSMPDVDRAHKFGLRYVHLPIKYEGVTKDQGEDIAKALEELPGPIYVHCHHGKHRSAAAVAVACVFNGQLQPAQAETVLQTFGTGANYKGLWKAARDAKPVDPQELRDRKLTYHERQEIDDLGETMVHVDEAWDHMKLIQKAGWKSPADHPDLDPPHIALMLEEMMHEASRLDKPGAHPPDFHQRMSDAEAAMKSLGEVLSKQPVDAAGASAAFDSGASSCASCHKAYRD